MTEPSAPESEERKRAKDRAAQLIRQKPHSVAELAEGFNKAPKVGSSQGRRKELAAWAVKDLLADGAVYVHPVGGRNRSLRYGGRPADPNRYFSKSGLRSVQTPYKKLVQAGVAPGDALAAIGGKLDPPVTPTPAGESPAAADAAGDSWLDEVVRMVGEQKRDNPFKSLTFPEVYERLKASCPALGLAEFHEGLRRLHERRKVRLRPYTKAMATIPDPRNALYLDREVKFYVDLP